jgi:hypothetical protein
VLLWLAAPKTPAPELPLVLVSGDAMRFPRSKRNKTVSNVGSPDHWRGSFTVHQHLEHTHVRALESKGFLDFTPCNLAAQG